MISMLISTLLPNKYYKVSYDKPFFLSQMFFTVYSDLSMCDVAPESEIDVSLSYFLLFTIEIHILLRTTTSVSFMLFAIFFLPKKILLEKQNSIKNILLLFLVFWLVTDFCIIFFTEPFWVWPILLKLWQVLLFKLSIFYQSCDLCTYLLQGNQVPLQCLFFVEISFFYPWCSHLCLYFHPIMIFE